MSTFLWGESCEPGAAPSVLRSSRFPAVDPRRFPGNRPSLSLRWTLPPDPGQAGSPPHRSCPVGRPAHLYTSAAPRHLFSRSPLLPPSSCPTPGPARRGAAQRSAALPGTRRHFPSVFPACLRGESGRERRRRRSALTLTRRAGPAPRARRLAEPTPNPASPRRRLAQVRVGLGPGACPRGERQQGRLRTEVLAGLCVSPGGSGSRRSGARPGGVRVCGPAGSSPLSLGELRRLRCGR